MLPIINKFQSKFHQKYKRYEIQDHNLLYLFLEISKRCNLNCLHCGSDCKSGINSPELTTESWFKIIEYISKNYSKELAFIITGGEPTLHPDLIKIGNKIKESENRWGMVTNGMSLSANLLSELTDANLYSITISLDGLEKSHNKLRDNNKSFKKVIDSLDLIGKSNIKFKDVVTCVYPDNLNELDEIAKILIAKKIAYWRLFRIFPSGRAFNNPVTQLTFEQTQNMLNWIKTNKKRYKKVGLNINLSCEGWLPLEIDKKVRDFPFFCRSGVNFASILSDGTITGCSNNHESFYRGNILNDNFSYIWENEFDIFRNRNWIKNTVCQKCEYCKFCSGGSIHLWELNENKPKFCYVKDL